MSELAIPKGRVRIPELVTYILIGAVVMVLLLSMPARLSPQEQCAAEGGVWRDVPPDCIGAKR